MLSNRRRWIIFAAVSIFFGLAGFYRTALAVLTTDLMRDVPMDMGSLGLVSAAYFYTYALFQIPGGLLLDRFSPAKVMTAYYSSALVGVLLFSMAESPGVMVLARLLMGAGMACSFIGALKIISRQFPPDRFATMSGIVSSVGSVGIIAATTPLVLWTQALGWRTAFLFVGIFHLMVILAFVSGNGPGRGPEMPVPAGANWKDQFRGLHLVLRTRQVWLISSSAFLRYGILAAVQGLWAGPYLLNVMGCSPVTVGNLLLLLTLGVVIGSPLSGFLSDRVFRTRKRIVVVALTGLSLILTALALVPFGSSPWLLAVLFLLFGLLNGAGVIPFAHLKETTPSERPATALMVLSFSSGVGAGVFMQGLGLLMNALHPTRTITHESFASMFLICAVMMGIGAVLYAFTCESAERVRG